MRFIKVLLLLAIFVMGLMFFIQNSVSLESPLKLQFDLYVDGLKWMGEGIPFYFVVLAAFGVGMLFATILLLFDRIRIGCELMRRKREVRDLKSQLKKVGANLEAAVKKSEEQAKKAEAEAIKNVQVAQPAIIVEKG